ncbi:MAG: hypothetical protein QOE54_5994, partial [Streptosporangiaceae bacterium]|nr:hypothetical protein [Streptosporangiaceae bacterium]
MADIERTRPEHTQQIGDSGLFVFPL